jgi:D-3-phosphoglycerate dehydrogenase
MEKVLITEPIHPDAIKMLENSFYLVFADNIESSTILRLAEDCSGILVRVAKITGDMMSQMPQIKVIAKHGIGLDNIDLTSATEKGIAIVNTPTANVNAVAEHALAIMLALMKNLIPLDNATRLGDFVRRNRVTNTEISGKKIGLIGLGKIARRFAALLQGFNVSLYGYDPFVKQEEVVSLGIQSVSKQQLLQTADIVSIHVPLTKETFHLLSNAEFQLMKDGAMLINTSRGQVVDEEALFQALTKGKLAGAALDVFESEPPSKDNPLFKLNNIVVSPHNAALTDIALRAMAMDSAQGIVDVLNGKVPKYLANKAVFSKHPLFND